MRRNKGGLSALSRRPSLSQTVVPPAQSHAEKISGSETSAACRMRLFSTIPSVMTPVRILAWQTLMRHFQQEASANKLASCAIMKAPKMTKITRKVFRDGLPA